MIHKYDKWLNSTHDEQRILVAKLCGWIRQDHKLSDNEKQSYERWQDDAEDGGEYWREKGEQ